MSQHFTATAAGKHESDSQMHCSGFTGAVGAEKAKYLAAFNTQREIAQGGDPLAAKKAAVMLAHIVERKGRNAGHEWLKDNTATKKKGLRRSEGLFVAEMLLRAQKEQHEGKQNQ
jgi:hypothetical protein